MDTVAAKDEVGPTSTEEPQAETHAAPVLQQPAQSETGANPSDPAPAAPAVQMEAAASLVKPGTSTKHAAPTPSKKPAGRFGLPKNMSPHSLPIPKQLEEGEDETDDDDDEVGKPKDSPQTPSSEQKIPGRLARKRKAPQLPTAATRKMKTRGKKLKLTRGSASSSEEGDFFNKRRADGSKYFPSRSQPSPSSDSDSGDFLSSALNLEYSWDTLHLGEALGSAALNRYLKRAHPEPHRAPSLTAQQTLQMVQSLRIRTVIAPPFSEMHRVIHKEFYDELEALGPASSNTLFPSKAPRKAIASNSPGGKQQTYGGPLPMLPPPLPAPLLEELSDLYEFMCDQDVDDGEVSRREVHYLSEGALTARLRSLENQASEIKLREDKLMKESREMELTDFNEATRLMAGYRFRPDAGQTSKHGPVV